MNILATLYGIMLLEGLYLWLIMVGLSIAALFFAENESPKFCTTTIIAALLILEFCTTIHPISSAVNDPVTAALYIAGYIALGTAYIFLKWTSFVYSIRSKFYDIKQDVIESMWKNSDRFGDKKESLFLNASDESSRELTDDGIDQLYSSSASRLHVSSLPLEVREYKATIYMWWAIWPISGLWTVVNDPVRRIGNFIYNMSHNTLQRISTNAFKFEK